MENCVKSPEVKGRGQHCSGEIGVDPNTRPEACHIEHVEDLHMVIAADGVSQGVNIIPNPTKVEADIQIQAAEENRKPSLSNSVEPFGSQCSVQDSWISANETQTMPQAEQSASEAGGSKEQLLSWVSSYDKVEELVREYEIKTTSKFLMANPDRDFGKTFEEMKHHHHIHLDCKGFGNELSPRLCLEGMPYIMMGNRRLTCHHGKPHYQSAKKPRAKGKQRLCTQASKKVGCPAYIFIRHVMLLLDFSFDKNTLTEHRRRELSKRIKATWKEQGSITTESRYYIDFPDVSSHKNHPIGEAAGIKQPIDKRVNDKMLQLISNGMRSVPVIERCIQDFVRDELFKGSSCPPDTNRRFFPTQKDIANRIFKVSVRSHSSKLRRRELEELVGGWLREQRIFKVSVNSCSSKLRRSELEQLAGGWLREQMDRDGFVFFRNALDTSRVDKQDSLDKAFGPERRSASEAGEMDKDATRVSSTKDGNAGEEPLLVSPGEGLLLVYQTWHQRRLLARYGCYLTFLDSAHRQAGYAIPLYFVLVHTNCGYQIVALIAMAKETVGGLHEALGLIREANPCWCPQQFMVEPSEIEIQAIKGIFQDCQVFITDTRRQQAWERFLLNSKHRTANVQQDVLAKMASIATARTQEAYQAALEGLRRTWMKPALKQTRAWFREKWMANVERWAYIYRQHHQLLPLVVNKGLESQSQALEYPFIASKRNIALHAMLDLLVSKVLPDLEMRYLQTNEAWITTADSSLSPFLHKRPQHFIDHCRQHLTLARRIEKTSITQDTQNIFRVPRGDQNRGDNFVDLSVPSCTCKDFLETEFPCMHLLACITDGNKLHWEQLPSSYLFSPFLTVDDGQELGGAGSMAVGGVMGGAPGGAAAISHSTEERPPVVDVRDTDDSTVAVSGISSEEKATSNLEAILAAVEAHQTLKESADSSMNSTPRDSDPFQDEAVACQAIARELVDLTHTVTHTETLARARVQMDAALATLRQALPRGELHTSVCQDQTSQDMPVCFVKGGIPVNQDLHPAKRQRLEEEVHQSAANDCLLDSHIKVAITRDVEVAEAYKDGGEGAEVDESIVTETIDLQQGAVFILEPSGMMRNVQIMDASEADEAAVGTVIIKDS
ncbi:uncharacterized protein LOC110979536 isoform X2 [Acanthaster planci]|nr:uncharacterized protein LOC110979536 isoform X2 [Acanthaster planci]XP_022091098.1 uncharacterized protein LOC110979536 isoform X2 [Acanthaster planci]XP_022091099.1 uncharacterized protein LOC110979536 isoform X2 [Acanthaster planci]XP_022091101.1 uncharacterized protein LOC110979536 isoform X2 [Acanthaster planci]XP_022091102.1 uncharacterized protein LOC110979536 isoform X2 [Acanthaster planci]XP_022091103.1 uncharacterized protein LOC110979536 isoform X2 [Acanthaster planci]XP_02209110